MMRPTAAAKAGLFAASGRPGNAERPAEPDVPPEHAPRRLGEAGELARAAGQHDALADLARRSPDFASMSRAISSVSSTRGRMMRVSAERGTVFG